MTTVTENITPAKAQEYLRTNDANRPISKVYVRSYADTMRRGAWLMNGVPIIFDTEGRLLDGQHRLRAVVEAGIPVRFDVVRGAPSAAFTTYDTGRHRNLGQIIAMQGTKHYNLIGSIVNANEILIKSHRLCANNGIFHQARRQTLTDLYDKYIKDSEGFQEIAKTIVTFESRCRILPGSWAGGLYYYLTHTGGYDQSVVHPFFEAVYTLEDKTIPAATLLQKTIAKDAIEGRSKKDKMAPVKLWVYIVKSWNSYITNSPLKRLIFDEDDNIPELKLKD